MPGTTITETAKRDATLTFTEADHSYILKSRITGETRQLISVTTLLDRFFPEFDADAMAPRVAARRGVSVAQIKAEWDANRDEAARYGTRVHENMEDTMLGRRPRNIPENDKEASAFTYGISFAKKLRERVTDIQPEKVICDPKVGIAGTIDLLCRDPAGGYLIFDWKTNKEIRMKSNFGKFGFGPLAHLEDCEYAHYSMQLNTYEFILKHAGYISHDAVVGKYLVHIHYENGIKLLQVHTMQREVTGVLNRYIEGRLPNG